MLKTPAVLALLASLSAPGFADLYSATASGSATARSAAYPSQLVDSHGYGGVPASSGSAMSATHYTFGGSFYNSSHAEAASSATLGVLHASASGGGSIDPAYGAVGFYTNFAQGQATATAAFTDTVTLTSNTLPVGTTVQYQVTVTLHAIFGFMGAADFGKATLFAMNNSMGLVRTGAPGEATQMTSIRTGTIGSTFGIDASLTAQATGSASFSYPNSTVQGEASVDASNTSVFTIKMLTAGASYTSASHTSYQAVPEPAGLGALAVGLIALGRRRRSA